MPIARGAAPRGSLPLPSLRCRAGRGRALAALPDGTRRESARRRSQAPSLAEAGQEFFHPILGHGVRPEQQWGKLRFPARELDLVERIPGLAQVG